MDALSEKSTVADWVTASPAYSRVFEELGIDYCCGGRTPLREVCAQKSLEIGQVMRKLQRAKGRQGFPEHAHWADEPIEDLIEHIETVHHRYLRDELPRLSHLVAKVREVHGSRHPELFDLEQAYDALKEKLQVHMSEEETVLFPWICGRRPAEAKGQSYAGGIKDSLRAMEAEHEEAGRALRRLRQLSRDYTPPEDACSSYRVLMTGLEQLEFDLHRHIHEENNILFSRALQTRSTAGAE